MREQKYPPPRRGGLTSSTSLLLDVIRILAAWLVTVGHGFSFFQLTVLKNQEVFPYIQFIGVVLLLLLSGILMANSIQSRLRTSENAYTFSDFLIDKICRIVVPLFPALCLVVFVDNISIARFPQLYGFYEQLNFGTFIGNLFLIQKMPLFGNNACLTFGSAAQLWTLALEWWCYIPIGYFTHFILSKYRKNALRLWQVVLLAILSYPAITTLFYNYNSVPCATIVVILGIGLYYMMQKLKDCESKEWLSVATVVGLATTIICGFKTKNVYGMPFVFSITITVLCAFTRTQQSNSIMNNNLKKALRFFSNYTYSLYLVHYSIMDLFYRKYMLNGMIPSDGWKAFVISILISNAVAIVFARIFERNSSRLSVCLKSKIEKLQA